MSRTTIHDIHIGCRRWGIFGYEYVSMADTPALSFTGRYAIVEPSGNQTEETIEVEVREQMPLGLSRLFWVSDREIIFVKKELVEPGPQVRHPMLKAAIECCGFGEFKCDTPVQTGSGLRCVDRCISDVVAAINADDDWQTLASCCGHQLIPGSVIIESAKTGTHHEVIVYDDAMGDRIWRWLDDLPHDAIPYIHPRLQEVLKAVGADGDELGCELSISGGRHVMCLPTKVCRQMCRDLRQQIDPDFTGGDPC